MATKAAAKTEDKHVAISAPNFKHAEFEIVGLAGSPLVIHRFSKKTKDELLGNMVTGKPSGSRRKREALDTEEKYKEARYMSPDGWDGFNAASMRNAMISACRLVNFKMTVAKLSIFVEADGNDALEPQIPLIRIHGNPVMQQDMARVDNGNPYITIRPAYHNWTATVRIRWDGDQFTLEDVSNLLSRVGLQVGIGEGRPDSKNSAGLGWGMFTLK